MAAIFEENRVPFPHFDFLSINLRTFDLDILATILSRGYQPRLIAVAINEEFGPKRRVHYPGTADFGRRKENDFCGDLCTFDESEENPSNKKITMCGASSAAVADVAKKFGYLPTYLTRYYLFLIRSDLVSQRMLSLWTWERVVEFASYRDGIPLRTFPREECDEYVQHLNIA